MSTRSGKRIHSAVDSPIVEKEIVFPSERKTRSKKQKENVNLTVKKRHNYVSYPADEDTASVSSEATDTREKVKRTARLRRNTLKELNADEAASSNIVLIEGTKSVRKSRRGKKGVEEGENPCDTENIQNNEQLKSSALDKRKSKKKKNHEPVSTESPELQEKHNRVAKKKVTKKKKKSNSFIIDSHERQQSNVAVLNKSNTSVDSFHSAAGSPMNEIHTETSDQTKEAVNFIQHEPKNRHSQSITESDDGSTTLNTTMVTPYKKERKSSSNYSLLHKIDAKPVNENNSYISFDKTTKELPDVISTGKASIKKKKKFSVKKLISDNMETKHADLDNPNERFSIENKVSNLKDYKSDKSTRKGKQYNNKNSAFDKIKTVDADFDNLNQTFEKTNKATIDINSDVDLPVNRKQRSNIKNSTFDKIEINDADNTDLNATFEKTNKSTDFNSNVDGSTRKRKNSHIKNSTFDKMETKNSDIRDPNAILEKMNETTDLKSELFDLTRKRRNSQVKNSTFDITETKDSDITNLNATFEKMNETTELKSNLGDSTKKRRNSHIKNSTFEITETKSADRADLNATFEKINETKTDFQSELDMSKKKRRKSSFKNSTFDEMPKNDVDIKDHNTTYEKIGEGQTVFESEVDVAQKKRRSSLKNFIFGKIESNVTITAKNTEFDLTFECHKAAGSCTNDDSTYNADKINGELHSDATNDLSKPCENDLSEDCNISMNKMARKFSLRTSMNDSINKDLEILSSTKDTDITFETANANPQNSTYDKEPSLTNNFTQDTIITTEKDLKNYAKTNSNAKVVVVNNKTELNTTFDNVTKVDTSDDSKKSSLISSGATINSTFDNSRISITSDESKTENILNHTPVLIESSIDDSRSVEDKTPDKSAVPLTPLKRESTFTKDENNAVSSPNRKSPSPEKTPAKRKSSPGRTPFPVSKSSQKKQRLMNVTRSIEKPSHEIGQRQTRVMFCSPVNNPVMASHIKGRVIKSNLKGSNKSFVFDDSVSSEARTRRKRSLTLGEAEARAKRSRLAGPPQTAPERPARPRSASAAAKLTDAGTPSKAKPDGRVARTRLPNFAALHQKQFARMESLDECQARRAQRARQLLTPTGCVAMLERISPKDTPPQSAPPPKESVGKLHTPSKPKLPTLESLNPGYSRFGFKLKTEGNPFTVTKKTDVKKERFNEVSKQNLSRQNTCLTLPSLSGVTVNRRDVAKQTVMREKSFTEKRDVTRKQTRTVIKGVRTNRRFELQMQLRNLDS